MKNYRNSLSWLMVLVIFLTSCSSNELLERQNPNQKSISIELNGISTRSLDGIKSSLDAKDCTLFLFDYDSQGEGELLLSTFDSNVTIGKDNNGKLIAKMDIPETIKGELQLLALYHHKIDKNKLYNGITYNDFKREQLLDFRLKGKESNPDMLPMWGESVFTIEGQSTSLGVKMIRSYARVNIELKEQRQDAKYKMRAISSVRVYRSLSYGAVYAAPSTIDENNKIIAPTIPSNVPSDGIYATNSNVATNSISEANADPLKYIGGEDITSISNQIFLCEAKQDSQTSKTRSTTIVVGVYLEGDDNNEHFYRVDFADYSNSNNGGITLNSIVRNHSYVFGLNGAETEGATDPEEALRVETTAIVDVVDWNDFIIDGENLVGDYYLKMNTDDLTFSFKKDYINEVSFESDVSIDQLFKLLKVEMIEGAEFFKPEIDINNSIIRIKTLQTNTDKAKANDGVLKVTLLNQAFKIKVHQRPKTAQFELSQKTHNIHGVYVVNKELTQDNYIKVRLIADKREDIENLPFNLSARVNDGLYINFNGIFSSRVNLYNDIDEDTKEVTNYYYEDFIVPFSGSINGPKDKLLTLETDCDEPSFLTIIVPVAYTKKKILGLFNGYSLIGNSDLTKLTKPRHFGISNDDIVKSEGFEYIESNNTDITGVIKLENPDIIIIGKGYSVSPQGAIELTKFMTNRNSYGGFNTIIFMSTDQSIVNILQELQLLTEGYTASKPWDIVENVSNSFNGFDSKIRRQPHYQYRYKLPHFSVDYITNGAFAQLAQWSIQLDSKSTAIDKDALEYLRIIKYCGILPYQVNDKIKKQYDYAHTIFRDTKYPFLYIGCDNFLNINQGNYSNGLIYREYEDSITVNKESLYCITNALFFANVMYWALNTVEYGNDLARK